MNFVASSDQKHSLRLLSKKLVGAKCDQGRQGAPLEMMVEPRELSWGVMYHPL
jgi:hypothetical protein